MMAGYKDECSIACVRVCVGVGGRGERFFWGIKSSCYFFFLLGLNYGRWEFGEIFYESWGWSLFGKR